MTRKFPMPDRDYIVELYLSGKTVEQVARTIGCSVSALEGWAKRNEVRFSDLRPKVRTVPYQRIEFDVDEAIRLYESGMPKRHVARHFGVAEMVIHERFKERGILPAPNRSEAMRRRLARMTPDERAALVAPAHDAVRGKKRSHTELVKRADTREQRGGPDSFAEHLLTRWLHEYGYETVSQKAIGIYNVDIATAPVAVEVFGGHWHANGRHGARLPERTRYILNQDWNLYIIWVNGLNHPLTPVVLRDLIPFIEHSRTDPTFRGQYRVIWGDGQFYAAGSRNDDQFTLIAPRGLPERERS